MIFPRWFNDFCILTLLVSSSYCLFFSTSAGAFQWHGRVHQRPVFSSTSIILNTRLNAETEMENCNYRNRRTFLNRGAETIALVLIGTTTTNQPAKASYTAYTRREDDWKARVDKGEVKFSNAAQLRAQLREIAPMNAENSKIFCPNGESSAVSPLMENKCGDRQALPSVYGRKDDIMGNSIPGFGGESPSLLRAELDRQAYFRSN